jgi:pyruvate-formate lyase-activating enzyme
MPAEFTVNIEVVGTCNLTCPSCPVGSYGAARADPVSGGSIGGTMSIARFRETIGWIRREIVPRHRDVFVALYSWGEPLIHPGIGELIGIARAAGFRVGLSSNLNHARHLEAAILAGVDEFVVSLSGFHQDIYEQGHRGGDVELVKANMAELSRLIRVHHAATTVHVHYITYRHNVGRDVNDMASLADRLGFHFMPSVAYFLPVEKLLEAAEGRIAAADQPIVDRLLVPLEDQLAIGRGGAGPDEGCDLIASRLDIDVDGAVKLCCSSYERRHNVAEGLEDAGFASIQARREAAALCGPCMARGIHRIYTRKDYDVTLARADAALTQIGSQHRFLAPGGLAAQADTESALLDRMLQSLIAGDLQSAWQLREALHALVAAKYAIEGPVAAAIADRLAAPGARRGRDLPMEPAQLLFADAVLARNLHGKPAKARGILDAVSHVLDRLAGDGDYRDTIAAMRPIIAAWQALPVA